MNAGDSPNVTVYAFPTVLYPGGYTGQYEFTFVAIDQNAQVQWSEDPEFDTTN